MHMCKDITKECESKKIKQSWSSLRAGNRYWFHQPEENCLNNKVPCRIIHMFSYQHEVKLFWVNIALILYKKLKNKTKQTNKTIEIDPEKQRDDRLVHKVTKTVKITLFYTAKKLEEN